MTTDLQSRKRGDCDEGEARRRIAAQLPIDEKREMADHIIDNSGEQEDTEKQVKTLYQVLTEAAH